MAPPEPPPAAISVAGALPLAFMAPSINKVPPTSKRIFPPPAPPFSSGFGPPAPPEPNRVGAVGESYLVLAVPPPAVAAPPIPPCPAPPRPPSPYPLVVCAHTPVEVLGPYPSWLAFVPPAHPFPDTRISPVSVRLPVVVIFTPVESDAACVNTTPDPTTTDAALTAASSTQ